MLVKLPPTFYYDHLSRDLPSGTVVKDTKTYVLVEVSDDELAEILSDARYYAFEMGEAGYEDRGVIASAKATVRAIARQAVV